MVRYPLPGRPRLVARPACWPSSRTALETALWTAFRALEERAALAARMAERFRSKGPGPVGRAVRGPGPRGQGAVGADPPGAR